METISVPPLEFLVWDVSGQDRLRSFWRHYYRQKQKRKEDKRRGGDEHRGGMADARACFFRFLQTARAA